MAFFFYSLIFYGKRSKTYYLQEVRVKNNQFSRALLNPHIAISFALGFVVLFVFAYSLLFSGSSHPIPALLTEQTGIIPPSKGLSSAFSEIVRGNFSQAIVLNPHSIRIFAFFALQLLVRFFIVLILFTFPNLWKKLAIADGLFSLLLFIYCFYPLIEYTFRMFAALV